MFGDRSSKDATEESIVQQLSFESAALFRYLPEQIRHELLLERDPHGNVQVSKIETESLLIHLCEHEVCLPSPIRSLEVTDRRVLVMVCVRLASSRLNH